MQRPWWVVPTLIVILAGAFFLRIHEISLYPAGLFHDEAMNAIDSRDVIEHAWFPIYFERNTGGREPLFIYALAGSMELFGQNVFALRLVPICFGLLTVALIYPLGTRLFDWRVGLIGSASMATMYWPVHLSRTDFRAITLPFLLGLAIYWLWCMLEGEAIFRGRKPDRVLPYGDLPRDKIEAGYFSRGALLAAALAAGLVMYTYFSSRIIPLLWIILFVYILLLRPQLIRLRWRAIAIFAVLTFLIFLPLGIYYATHQDIFFTRLEQVATVGGTAGGVQESLIESIRATLLMFNVRGDSIAKYNLSGRPVFGPIEALIFFAGLLACLRYLLRPAYGMLLIWLAVMLLPGALSSEAPQFLRVTGVMPPVALMLALGVILLIGALIGLLERIKLELPGKDWWQRATRLAGVAALLIGVIDGVGTYRDYFQVWGPSADAYYAMNGDVDALSRFLAAYPHAGTTLAVSTLYYHHPTVDFFLPGENLKWFDATQNIIFPAGGKDVIYGFPHQAQLSQERLQRYFPLDQASLIKRELGPDGDIAFEVYRLPATALHPASQPQHTLQATLGGTDNDSREVALLGYDMDTRTDAGGILHLALYWRVLKQPQHEYTFFSHLVDDTGKTVTQGDINHYPTEEWQPGDLVVGWYDIAVPPDLAAGRYGVEVGLFDRVTFQNLPAIQDGKPSDRVILEPVKIAQKAAPQIAISRPITGNIEFGDFARLLGYDLPQNDIKAGGTLTLTLYWRAQAAPARDYTVFAQVLDEAQTGVWGQRDQQPQQGHYPTSIWEAGDIIVDRYAITIKPDTKPGTYLLQIGMYRPDTGQRLPVTQDGKSTGDHLLLPIQINVHP